MSKKKDWSKVQRYGMVDKNWYGEEYREMGECSYGDYVAYEDYTKLLKEKVPARLPATFKDLKKIINQKIKELEAEAVSIFEKKNKVNYGYAVQTYGEADELRAVLRLMEEKVFTK